MILAFDTSLSDLHIGLFSDNSVLLAEFHKQVSPDERGIHDGLLALKTSELLETANAKPGDISKITLIIGPGSFTGLRIGLSFAKGLAFGLGAGIIPLKAHRVLLHAFEKKHKADAAAIAYPGYEASNFYIADAKTPEVISYKSVNEIGSSGVKMIITPERIEALMLEQTVVPIDLDIMAELARDAQGPFVGVSELEPFYGTDFKVKG